MKSFEKEVNKQEKNTVEKMIRLYCKKKHKTKGSLCEECLQIKEYALQRLTKCPYGDDKPTCEKCPIHCYKAEMRKKIQVIMRYAGPRMIIYHPIAAIKHLFR